MTENPEEEKSTESSGGKLPRVVYHYTSMDALMGIMKTRNVWATAISYLNDVNEREFLLDAARKRLTVLQEQDPNIDKSFTVPSLHSSLPNDITPFAGESFVTSFASQPDSLMHWRSYCPQQSGVALGFRTECLKRAYLAGPKPGMIVPPSGFGQVAYVNPEKSLDVDSAIYTALGVVAAEKRRDPASAMSPSAVFSWAINVAACTSKHSSFEVEGEYRLLVAELRFREDSLRFRTVRSSLVPFVEMHIPNREEDVPRKPGDDSGNPWTALQSVVIGPTANMTLTKKSLTAYFALRGMDVEVIGSVIPYRDW